MCRKVGALLVNAEHVHQGFIQRGVLEVAPGLDHGIRVPAGTFAFEKALKFVLKN